MADYQVMGGVPDWYSSMTSLAQQELVRLPDGTFVAAPQYGQATSLDDIYGGVLPTGIPPIGVQGTKRNRGSLPSWDNSLNEPWGGAYDQTAYRNGTTRRDIIQNIPAPPVQTASNYSTLDTVTPLDISRLGLTTSPFRSPAERAIVEATIRGGAMPPTGGSGRGRPTRRSIFGPIAPPVITQDDPWATLRLDPEPQPRRGLVTATPQGSGEAKPQQRGFSLLDAVLSMGGGEGPPRTNPNITYDQPRVVVPGTAGEINGVDMAFMPPSVQQSSRWRTGY